MNRQTDRQTDDIYSPGAVSPSERKGSICECSSTNARTMALIICLEILSLPICLPLHVCLFIYTVGGAQDSGKLWGLSQNMA